MLSLNQIIQPNRFHKSIFTQSMLLQALHSDNVPAFSFSVVVLGYAPLSGNAFNMAPTVRYISIKYNLLNSNFF